jgi:hypothetical protein
LVGAPPRRQATMRLLIGVVSAIALNMLGGCGALESVATQNDIGVTEDRHAGVGQSRSLQV